MIVLIFTFDELPDIVRKLQCQPPISLLIAHCSLLIVLADVMRKIQPLPLAVVLNKQDA
jgi:hypothetical protein